MDISKKLKDRRIELKMTMFEVAQKVGVSEATVSRWESGDIANMRRDKIVKLSKALEVSPAFIMGWSDIPKPEKSDTLSGCDNKTAALIKEFEKLSDSGKDKVIDYASMVLSSEQNEK